MDFQCLKSVANLMESILIVAISIALPITVLLLGAHALVARRHERGICPLGRR